MSIEDKLEEIEGQLYYMVDGYYSDLVEVTLGLIREVIQEAVDGTVRS